jgi:CxxC motif-containing protein
MTEREYICVVCPNGCEISAATDDSGRRLIRASGFKCDRGREWIEREIENPMRTFSSSVPVKNGDFIEASVRVTKPVPLSKVFEIMDEIKLLRPSAPLSIGDVLLKNPAGTDTEVIVTRNVKEVKESRSHTA